MSEKKMTLEEQLYESKEQLQELIDYRNAKILSFIGFIGILIAAFLFYILLVSIHLVPKDQIFAEQDIVSFCIGLLTFLSIRFMLFPEATLTFLKTLRVISEQKNAIRQTEQYLKQRPKIDKNIDGNFNYAAP